MMIRPSEADFRVNDEGIVTGIVCEPLTRFSPPGLMLDESTAPDIHR